MSASDSRPRIASPRGGVVAEVCHGGSLREWLLPRTIRRRKARPEGERSRPVEEIPGPVGKISRSARRVRGGIFSPGRRRCPMRGRWLAGALGLERGARCGRRGRRASGGGLDVRRGAGRVRGQQHPHRGELRPVRRADRLAPARVCARAGCTPWAASARGRRPGRAARQLLDDRGAADVDGPTPVTVFQWALAGQHRAASRCRCCCCPTAGWRRGGGDPVAVAVAVTSPLFVLEIGLGPETPAGHARRVPDACSEGTYDSLAWLWTLSEVRWVFSVLVGVVCLVIRYRAGPRWCVGSCSGWWRPPR